MLDILVSDTEECVYTDVEPNMNVSETLYLVLGKKFSTLYFSNLFITWETLWKVQTKLKYNDTTEE